MAMSCQKGEDLLDLLYGEGSAETRALTESHVAGCAGCRQELDELRSVRRQLADWQAPSWRETPLRRRAWPRRLAAAAAVLLALGATFRLSGGSLKVGGGEVRISWGAQGVDAEVKALLAAAEERHQRDLEALRASRVSAAPAPSRAASDDTVLPRVKEMIEESESRQSHAWQAGLQELAVQTEERRRLDLARVSAGFSYLAGKSGQQAARTTELMGYLMQASDQK